MPLPLLALFVAAFGVGTTEFVIMGLLPEVADSLHVDIPAAGLLITGYALGVVVGGPILAILTSRMARKSALLILMGLFLLGNLLCAVAPTYAFLMVARIVAGFCHGAFFGIGAIVAADLVPANKRASAVATMFSGLTVANILGVPGGNATGAWIGAAALTAGVAYRELTFVAAAIAIIGLVAAIVSHGMDRHAVPALAPAE